MATIGRNGKAWRARIRRAGFPDLQANFPTKQQAKMWANKKESEIDQAKVFGKEQLELPPKLQRNVEPTIDQVIFSYRQLHTSGKRENERLEVQNAWVVDARIAWDKGFRINNRHDVWLC